MNRTASRSGLQTFSERTENIRPGNGTTARAVSLPVVGEVGLYKAIAGVVGLILVGLLVFGRDDDSVGPTFRLKPTN